MRLVRAVKARFMAPLLFYAFLADENVLRLVVEGRRAAGFDVAYVRETRPGASDIEVLEFRHRHKIHKRRGPMFRAKNRVTPAKAGAHRKHGSWLSPERRGRARCTGSSE